MLFLASRGSAVVENLPRHTMVKGLSPVNTGREKIAKMFEFHKQTYFEC